MLVTFRSRFSGDVLMLAPHALQVLQAAGRSYEEMPSQGIFTLAQLPDAIASLEAAMAAEKAGNAKDGGASSSSASSSASNSTSKSVSNGVSSGGLDKGTAKDAAETAEGEEDTQNPKAAIALHQRAYPLLQMMKTALENEGVVVWGDQQHY